MHSDLAVNMRSFISSPQAAAAAFTGPVIEASSSSSSSDTISPSSAAAALSTSTLSSPISVSEEGIAGQKKKKEIILIGGSLGKRTMIKKHLQNHFPDVQEVWISPHDIYRNARVVTSPQGRVDGGPPGRTYAVPSNQVSANGVVDYSGVLDSLEKDLITRSQTAEILGVVPMLDAFVPFADRICAALGLPYCGNNPLTTEHRTDKALMQKCLAAKGLRHCESRCFTSAAQALEWRRPTKEAPLVVKPANSGGCDGVSVCVAEEEVRDAFDDNMYRVNAERLTNEKMVVQEYLGALEEEPMRTSLRRKRAKPGDNCDDLDSSSSGVAEAAGRSCRSCYEFIVNTVSTDGHHLVSDIWRGTPKAKPGSTECLYDIQESVSWSECPRQVLNYAFQVLDATGVRNGAAHTELMLRGEDVCLIEVNARIAGEVRGDLLRRVVPEQEPFDQLYWLLFSLIKPVEFIEATWVYRPESDCNVTALFLQCSEEGPSMISVRYLYSITQRSQFCRFGRALSPLNQAAPFHDEERFMKIAEGIPRVRNLKKTCDLISSPGVVIMRAEKNREERHKISKLTARIRKSEKDGTLYTPKHSNEAGSHFWQSVGKTNLWRRFH